MISAITEIQFMLSRDWLAHARSDGHTCKIPRNEVLKCSADFARIMYVSCEWLSKLFLLWSWSRRITPIIWTPRSKGTPRSKRPAGSLILIFYLPYHFITALDSLVAQNRKMSNTIFTSCCTPKCTYVKMDDSIAVHLWSPSMATRNESTHL